MVKRQHTMDKIRINQPIRLGEPADISVIDTNGNWQQLRTSSIHDYYYSRTGNIQIETKHSIYIGELENPEILDIGRLHEQSVAVQNHIRINQPMKLGEPADITVTDAAGNWQRLRTSPIYDYSYSRAGSIQIQTNHSVYAGELENPEILDIGLKSSMNAQDSEDFEKAVASISQPSGEIAY